MTNCPGQGAGVIAQFAYGPHWQRSDHLDLGADGLQHGRGNNDEYKADFTPEQTGSFQYLARFSTNLGAHWTYAYTDDNQRGALTVNPSSTPRRLRRRPTCTAQLGLLHRRLGRQQRARPVPL